MFTSFHQGSTEKDSAPDAAPRMRKGAYTQVTLKNPPLREAMPAAHRPGLGVSGKPF